MSSENNTDLRQAVTAEFTAAGFPTHLIDSVLAKQDRLREEENVPGPTWIKIHRVHILPETLAFYGIEWDWDEEDSNYLLIKQWISEEEEEVLFEHTRRLREKVHNKQVLSVRNKERLTRINIREPPKEGEKRGRVRRVFLS